MRHPIPPPSGNDACGLCGYWKCRCRDIYGSVTQLTPTDSDMEEALRRVRAGKGAR